ncbi:MAG: hypothetical protein IJZ23_04400 [Roseburia sp.]|nr:hypothetical protein [Roseburia sp.]
MKKEACDYYEATFTMAGLNHTRCVGEENLGWTKGVLSNGIPFEAELWMMKGDLTLCVMMPEIFQSRQKGTGKNVEELDIEDNSDFVLKEESCILKIGMIDRGYTQDFDTIVNYVEYLEEFGLVEFVDRYRNGMVHFFTDCEGNNIASVIITLNEKGDIYAETPLVFRNFPGTEPRVLMYKKCTFDIIVL